MDAQRPWFEQSLAVVDVETTGLDPKMDRIIEIAVIRMEEGEVKDTYSCLVNPGVSISDEVANLTGIQQSQLEDAQPFSEVAAAVREALGDYPFVAYNANFDRAFVHEELKRADIDWEPTIIIDPLVFIRELHKGQGSKRLGAAAERLGIPLDNAHRASDDAEVAGRILYALQEQLPGALEDLVLLQRQWQVQQENEMASWRKGRAGSIDDTAPSLGQAERGNALGPAYLYGDETDPVRAMFTHLPDSGGRR